MARGPLQGQEDNGSTWWSWIVGLLLMIGGIMLLVALFERSAEEDPLRQVEGPVSAGKPVLADRPPPTGERPIGADELFEIPPHELVGQSIDVGGLRVTRVLAPRVFFAGRVGDELGRQFLVYADGDAPPDAGMAAAPGQRVVDLDGRVEKVPGAERLRAWGLPPELAERVRREPIYLRAERLTLAPP